nr:MAG: hypothetical protein [Lokiarchaeota virus Fenrir Meg22_1012]URC17187.1 MAG: hypothetical protein [Lokiarchaeota virus Fenrir Meg22_1214]
MEIMSKKYEFVVIIKNKTRFVGKLINKRKMVVE